MGRDPGEGPARQLARNYVTAMATTPRSKGSDHWAAISTDGIMRQPVLRVADSRGDAVTFVYQFDWAARRSDVDLGAFHAIELPFVFDAFDVDGWDAFVGVDEGGRKLGRAMRSAWASFAATGDPSGGDLGPWPRYEPAARPTMVLDEGSRVVDDPLATERSWWAGLWDPGGAAGGRPAVSDRPGRARPGPGPELSAAVAEGDQLRRLPDATWKLLLESGFLRALQPARWGGGEVELVDFLDAVFELSRANPSAGWVAGVIGVHPWQLALFDERGAGGAVGRRCRRPCTRRRTTRPAPPSPSTAGTRCRAAGRSRRAATTAGRSTSAPWSANSAAPGTWPTSGPSSCSRVTTASTTPGTWPACGARAARTSWSTGSSCPPTGRSRTPSTPWAWPCPGQVRNDGPLYRMPQSVVFNMAVAASVFGAAQGFVETWIDEARDRVNARRVRLADDPLMQRRVAEAAYTLDAATTMLRADAAELTPAGPGRRGGHDDRAGRLPLAPQPQLRAGGHR